ncbi:hypothetical protein BH11ARM2_BH11ARM2_10150 [soil metagenome]
MKLNLLPTTVSKERKARGAVLGAALIAIAGIIAGVFFTTASQKSLADAKQAEAEARPLDDRAVATSNQADAIMTAAQPIIRNSALAKAIVVHNRKYTDLYDRILPYVPRFFRITSISATPSGEQSTVQMQGVLTSYQQYSNLMLALLRIPGAQTVGRSGYIDRDLSVPQLVPDDQVGKPRRPGDAVIPDDPLQRLAYYQAQASTQSYTGIGNFGSEDTNLRFAGPESSLVTVTILMDVNLQVPDVKATLKSTGGGGLTGAPTSFGPPGGFPPGAGIPPSAGAPTRGGAPSGKTSGGEEAD